MYDSMTSTLKRTIDSHIEDADMWGDNLPTGDPMQMMGWRPTAYVLAQEVKRLREELDRSNVFLESAKSAFADHAGRLELRIKELEDEAKDVDARHAKVIEVWKKEENDWIEKNRRYKEALQSVLPTQDPLDAELVCDWCGASVDLDEAEGKHDMDCPWLLAHSDA